MFEMDHVTQSFVLLDEIEKEEPYFTKSQKQSIYRIALHTEDFEDVKRLILQATAPNLSTDERGMLLEHHVSALPEISDNIMRIEDYILQLRHMTYETDKANKMLEDILSRSSISKDLDVLIAEIQKKERTEPRMEKNEKSSRVVVK